MIADGGAKADLSAGLRSPRRKAEELLLPQRAYHVWRMV